MARKSRNSKRRNRGRRRGSPNQDKVLLGTEAQPLDGTRIIGTLPPLPITTRLLDRVRRRIGSEDFVWQRGVKYAEDKRVAYLKIRGDHVEAGVNGSRRYLVSIAWPSASPERFEGRCTCPFARKGSTCKHMVAAAMTLWFATQKAEEDDANKELSGAAEPSLMMRNLGPNVELRRPRGGIVAGSALPVWLAVLLDTEEAPPPPNEDGPTIPLNPNEPWISYDLLPGAADPMPIEVRVARMGPGMRPTRGKRIYEMDNLSLRELSNEMDVLPEDHLALTYLGARKSTTGKDEPAWDGGSLDRILRLLAHTRDVRIHGEAVRIAKTPIQLRLVVSDFEEDSLRFWIEPIHETGTNDESPDPKNRIPAASGPLPGLRHYIPANPGWVHLSDGSLHPLTNEGTRLLRTFGAFELDKLPTVANEDVDRFREREWPLLASRYPAEILTDRLPNVLAPRPEPRLYLTEPEDMSLAVRASFAYTVPAGDTVEAGPDSPHFLKSSDTEPLIERNPEDEAQYLAQLLQAVAASREIESAELDTEMDPWNIVLSGEDALSFLAEQLPLLESDFSIYGDENLSRLRVNRGDMGTNARVSSEMDWFDLKLGFTAGEQLASASAVLKAWHKKRRFVQMQDGSYAQVPTKWLERYGMLLEEAEHARETLGSRLPKYLASLGAALEDAVDNFQGDDRFEQLKNMLSYPEHLDAITVPRGMKAELRDYQKQGFTWLCWLSDQGYGGCLADDMGLGKTLQALTYILREKEEGNAAGKPVLVVAPTSVVFNWQQEAKRFCPTLNLAVYQGTNRKKILDTLEKGKTDIILTSYPLLRIDSEQLSSIHWHAVFLDESQHVKNADSQTAKSAYRLKSDHNFVMTGTPLENRLDDVWSQFHFTMPGFLGRRKSFARNYGVRSAGQIKPEILKDRLSGLRERIKPFILRRLKEEVAKELPERTEMILHVPLSTEEQHIYATVRDAYRAQVYGAMEKSTKGGPSLTMLEALLRLRQASCHPGLLPFEEAKELGARAGSSKLRTVIDTLEEIISEGHKALVFSQWTSLLDLTQSALKKSKIRTTRLDGSTKDRGAVVEQFQSEDGPPVFLLSLKAGGTGLNLTAADYVIHLDPWWNPAIEAQANDRAHRIGQTRPVFVIKLVSANTVEEKVVELQKHKKALFDAAINDGKQLEDLLTAEEVASFFEPTEAIPEASEIEVPKPEPKPKTGKSDAVRRRRSRRGRRDGGKGKAAAESKEAKAPKDTKESAESTPAVKPSAADDGNTQAHDPS
ncbi:MAG: hypothetical protein CMH54_12855 [Myxococcales bacterium]|nr:hypothetical protein [Myxococcales bacterium]